MDNTDLDGSRRSGGTLALALFVAVAASVSPGVGRAQSAIDDVALLAGCWVGGLGDLEMREQWSEPAGGVMLGTTRFLRDGELVDFEFGRLEESSDGVTLWPYPRGTLSEHGFPLVATGEELVFENPEHDFPVRIVYRRLDGGRLAPRIEGADGSGRGWELERVPCPA